MGEPTGPTEQEHYDLKFRSQEERGQPGVTALVANQAATSIEGVNTNHSILDPLEPINNPVGSCSSLDVYPVSRLPNATAPQSLVHSLEYRPQFSAHGSFFSEPKHIEDSLPIPTKRPSPDEDTQQSQPKTQKIYDGLPGQPLELVRWQPTPAIKSEGEQILHDQEPVDLTDGTYKPKEHAPRNQHVLGLKYMHDRYGRSKRPVLRPYEPPEYVDQVFGYHDYVTATTGPPPGLGTRAGQFAPTTSAAKSTLCRFRHQRMYRSKLEQSSHGSNGRHKDTVIQLGDGQHKEWRNESPIQR
jgi:hypothetical protein